jgi:hypothetical protein
MKRKWNIILLFITVLFSVLILNFKKSHEVIFRELNNIENNHFEILKYEIREQDSYFLVLKRNEIGYTNIENIEMDIKCESQDINTSINIATAFSCNWTALDEGISSHSSGDLAIPLEISKLVLNDEKNKKSRICDVRVKFISSEKINNLYILSISR